MKDQQNISHAIVLACDEQYAMPLATMLRSLVEANHSGNQLDIFVFSSNFTKETRNKILGSLPEGSVSIYWRSIDLSSCKEFATLPYISKMTYARLLIPGLLPDGVSRALYLDADVLVLQDLMPLWLLNLDGAAIGAVLDIDSAVHAKRLCLSPDVNATQSDIADGLRVPEYFNAGVLLIDLPQWRHERVTEKALAYLERYPDALLSDQDALNAVFEGRWRKLESRWNCQNHPPIGFRKTLPSQRPSIVHFVGKSKPWDARTFRVNAKFYNAFRNRTRFTQKPHEIAACTFQLGWAVLKRFIKSFRPAAFIYSYLNPSRVGASARILQKPTVPNDGVQRSGA